MKRLAALLLVISLVFSSLALAEGCRVSFSVSVADEAETLKQADAIARQFAELSPEANLQSLTDFLLRVARDTSFSMLVQPDAAAVDVVLAGYPVLDMNVYNTPDKAYMLTSLMPGYAMAVSHEAPASEADSQDAQLVFQSVSSVLSAWLAEVDGVQAEGVFMGDAYSGGVHCTTYTLYERDLAVLLTALMTPEVQRWLEPFLSAAEVDAAEFFTMLKDENDAHAAANQYTYVLRLVHGVSGEPVGVSLTILKEDVQIATASLELGQSMLQLVVGLGLPEENYWFDLRVDVAELDAMRCDTVRMREFRAPKDETYAYASGEHAPSTWLSWAFTSYESNGLQHIDALLTDELTSKQLRLHSSYRAEPLMLLIETVDLPVKLRFSCEWTEDAVPEMQDGLTVFQAEDPESEDYLAAMDEMTKHLGAKLLKVLPLDLLLLFQ